MRMTKCENCSAPVELGSDGTPSGCAYCGLGATTAIFDPLQLARAVAAEAADVKAFAERLATMLQKAFPQHTKLEHGGFFSKHLKHIHVEVKQHQYRLEVAGEAAKTHRARTVRGVRLKDEELALHAWLESLFQDLAELAAELRRDREAMEKAAR